MVLTGGGAQLHGLPEYLSQELKVNVEVSPDPVNCVALGTAMSLSVRDRLETGFTDATPASAAAERKRRTSRFGKIAIFLFIVAESGRKILYNVFKSVFAGGAMRFDRRRIND